MSYIATSFFDRKAWDKFGVKWIEAAKAENLTGFVVGLNIPETSRFLKQFGFYLVPVDDRSFYCEALAANLKKNQSCLFTYHDILPKGDLSLNKEIKCYREKSLDLFKTVAPIENLFNRAKAMNILEKSNDFFSTQSILGTFNFWTTYSGFQRYLYDINFLNRTASDELIFNLYIALMKPDSMEIEL